MLSFLHLCVSLLLTLKETPRLCTAICASSQQVFTKDVFQTERGLSLQMLCTAGSQLFLYWICLLSFSRVPQGQLLTPKKSHWVKNQSYPKLTKAHFCMISSYEQLQILTQFRTTWSKVQSCSKSPGTLFSTKVFDIWWTISFCPIWGIKTKK